MLVQVKQGIYDNYSSSISTPKLIRLSSNLIVALFELMKLIPAKYTVLKAIAEGKIDPKCPIVETSSGTYAHGLAITCAELSIPFMIISDPIIDEALKKKLIDLGGEVQIVSASADSLNVQTLRMKVLNDYLISKPSAFWTAQYDNPDNRKSYEEFAILLLERVGYTQFTLVGTVGSGGSTCGTIERLRHEDKNMRLIGVDTFGSALFGLEVSNRKLRGLGNSLLPKNVVHSYYDQIHWISADCAYKAVRQLHALTGLFCGPTTGAAFQVARWYAESHNDEQVVFISPDSGHRYTHTVYNDKWLKENDLNIFQTFEIPFKVDRLKSVREHWSYFDWNRRTYEEVLHNHA